MNEDMPWVNLTQEEVDDLRNKKYKLTNLELKCSDCTTDYFRTLLLPPSSIDSGGDFYLSYIYPIYHFFYKNNNNTIIEIKIVKRVSGKAFKINNFSPFWRLFLSRSIASEIECLTECKKQK